MQQSKKIHKKKTSTKKAERSPIFNESMMFSVPAHTLSVIISNVGVLLMYVDVGSIDF